MKEGYGEERYRDGSIYKGQFKENMKHGKGKLLLQGNGNYGYEGDFKEDKISGKGKFKWNSKKEYIGEWENNEIVYIKRNNNDCCAESYQLWT